MRVRRARPEDAAAIAPLIGVPGDLTTREVLVGKLLSEDRPGAHLWVAEDERGVVGFSRLSHVPALAPEDPRRVPEGWYLLGVHVTEAHRGRGLGTALTQARLDFARDHAEAGHVYLFRDRDNAASAALGAKFGHRLVQRDIVPMNGEEPERPLDLWSVPLPSWRLRDATRHDAPAIGQLIAGRSSRDPVAWAEKTRQALLRQDPPLHIFVAEAEGEVVGYTRVAWMRGHAPEDPRCVPEGWYLLGVNVREDYRRQGIGAALTRRRIAWLRERGATGWLRYFRDFDNHGSQALHAGFGFQVEAEDVWSPGLENPEKRLVLERVRL
ncbi:MAG: GNAT family N-acetyltransferase [Deltaproteobacteria bacterium]|nr:MAG: GNAT family N-acetyltransferase [Deltaproteobacteria bacterium]